MENSQPVLYQASAITDTSTCVSSEHILTNSDSVLGVENSDPVSAVPLTNASITDGGSSYENNPSLMPGNVPVDSVADVHTEITISKENKADTSAHAVGYDSVNGSINEMVNYQAVGAIENGVMSSDPGGAAIEQVYGDGTCFHPCADENIFISFFFNPKKFFLLFFALHFFIILICCFPQIIQWCILPRRKGYGIWSR